MTHRFLCIAAVLSLLASTALITGCGSSDSDRDNPAMQAAHQVPGARPATHPPLPDLDPGPGRHHQGDQNTPPPLPASTRPPPLPQARNGQPPALPATRHEGAQAPPPLPTGSGPSHQPILHVRQARIMDRQGFGRELPAMHLLLPADWTDQGQVVWQPHNQCQAEARQFQWQARSPDGSEQFEFLPGIGWSYSSFPQNGINCRAARINSAREFLEAVAQQRRPGARILGFESHDHLLGDLNRQMQQNTSLQVPGLHSRVWMEGGVLEIGFHENGREYNEQLIAFVVLHHMDMGGGFRAENGFAPAPMAMAYRYPAGRPNPLHIELIASSMRIGEEWNRQMMDHQAKMSGIVIDGMNERHQINMDTIAHIGNLSRASYNSRIGAMDRGSEQFSQTIRGVQTWTNPSSSGQSFELPQDYSNAWQLDDGTFVMTNNPDFNPWSDLRLRGERLEPAR